MQNAGLDRNGTVKRLNPVSLLNLKHGNPQKIDTAEMIRLYEAGRRTSEIAAHFGVKSPAVTRALNAAGIKPRRLPPVRDDALAELVAEGMSVSAASEALGICQQRASQMWQRICRGLGWQAQ